VNVSDLLMVIDNWGL